MDERTYVWCTYREWSFRILEGLLDLPGWRCASVVTTREATRDLSALEARGVEILRVDPRADMAPGGAAFERIATLAPATIFHYGWSWLVPPEMLALCPNVTLHPGKLPHDRGGSPIQNQILNGETWTYANVLQMSAGLDEGPVYAKARISLAGDVDDVWARMTATGARLTRDYLRALADGSARAEPQDPGPGSFHRRVTPAQAELKPREQSVARMADIVRAHAETDPDSYIRPAWLRVGDAVLLVDRASREAPGHAPVHVLDPEDTSIDALHALCAGADEGTLGLALEDAAGGRLHLRRCWVRVER